jgi:hypothetical protein
MLAGKSKERSWTPPCGGRENSSSTAVSRQAGGTVALKRKFPAIKKGLSRLPDQPVEIDLLAYPFDLGAMTALEEKHVHQTQAR